MSTQYAHPLSLLLTLGETGARANWNPDTWKDYEKLGFDKRHVPDLIAMLTDETLLANDDGPEIMAAVHAWRVLAEFQSVEAIPALVSLLSSIDENNDDWIAIEFPIVFCKIGGASLDPLGSFLIDSKHGLFARIAACRSIAAVGEKYPESKSRCVELLTTQLHAFETNASSLNAALVSVLADLKVVEHFDLVREAYAKDRVDLDVLGDLEDAEIEFGLRTERTTPRKLGKLGETFARIRELDALREARSSRTIVAAPKVGRNDPCPCRSGKKYKKCCGFANQPPL
jgi:hypothetical protein